MIDPQDIYKYLSNNSIGSNDGVSYSSLNNVDKLPEELKDEMLNMSDREIAIQSLAIAQTCLNLIVDAHGLSHKKVASLIAVISTAISELYGD